MDDDQATQGQAQAQGQDRRKKGVFWELGLAIKENDPIDPTGKKMSAVCKCPNDRDNPDSVCNKHIGKFVITRVFINITCNFRIISNISLNFRYFRIIRMLQYRFALFLQL